MKERLQDLISEGMDFDLAFKLLELNFKSDELYTLEDNEDDAGSIK